MGFYYSISFNIFTSLNNNIMDTKECTYTYFKDGYEMITPSLDHAIERTDQKKIKCKCSDDKEYKIIELK